MKIHRHFAYTCLACDNTLDASIQVTDKRPEHPPEPGDALICKRCGAIHVLTTEGLRPATWEERAEIFLYAIVRN